MLAVEVDEVGWVDDVDGAAYGAEAVLFAALGTADGADGGFEEDWVGDVAVGFVAVVIALRISDGGVTGWSCWAAWG